MNEMNRMRSEVTKAYPGKTWREKVKKMSDDKVTAIYLNLKARKRVT